MRGFTFVEVLITLAIFSMLAVLGVFMTMETFRNIASRSEQATVVAVLQKARSRAMANLSQKQWGVCHSPPDYVLFSGNYSAGASANEHFSGTTGVTITSTSDFFSCTSPGTGVVFEQLTGDAVVTGTIVLTQGDKTSITTINHEGAILW